MLVKMYKDNLYANLKISKGRKANLSASRKC